MLGTKFSSPGKIRVEAMHEIAHSKEIDEPPFIEEARLELACHFLAVCPLVARHDQEDGSLAVAFRPPLVGDVAGVPAEIAAQDFVADPRLAILQRIENHPPYTDTK